VKKDETLMDIHQMIKPIFEASQIQRVDDLGINLLKVKRKVFSLVFI
jgi:hypothetical protein